MSIVYILTTLSCSIVLPGLSRRTGEPCRVVSTRQLILTCDHAESISLVGCLDPRGEVFRVAVRDILAVQKCLIAHAEERPKHGRDIQTLEALAPAAFHYDAGATPYTYCSLGTQNSVELIGVKAGVKVYRQGGAKVYRLGAMERAPRGPFHLV
ncbi:MAG: hypothetical protein Q8S17_09390 [Humidesulfovibrio sp.]|nr:hypothetical protein [Humidesulfovibrio sp.]